MDIHTDSKGSSLNQCISRLFIFHNNDDTFLICRKPLENIKGNYPKTLKMAITGTGVV